MLQFAVLSFDLIVKSLERNQNVCFPGCDPFLKGLEMDWDSITCVHYGLVRICLTDLMLYVPWKGNLFPPRLTQGLGRSLSTSICDHVFDTVDIILFFDDSSTLSTPGFFKRSQLVSVLLSFASCGVAWSLERSLSACLSDDSYVIYTKGLEMSQIVLLSPASCIFGCDLERSLSACAHSHGPERTGCMVLKGLWCNSLVHQLCFAIYFQAMVLKWIPWSGVGLVFYGRNGLGNIFCIEPEWDLALNWLHVTDYDFFMCLGLYNITRMVLKWLIQVMLKSQFDTAMIYQLSIIITFEFCPGSY